MLECPHGPGGYGPCKFCTPPRLTPARENELRIIANDEPQSYCQELLEEIDALRDDLSCRGIHTCHDKCQNWICLMRKERDRLREALERAEATIEQTHTSGHSVVPMANCLACEYFRDTAQAAGGQSNEQD